MNHRSGSQNSSAGRAAPIARRGKSLSVGPLIISDPNFARNHPAAMTDDYAKKFPGPIEQLYHLGMDDPKLRFTDLLMKVGEPTQKPQASLDPFNPFQGSTRHAEFPGAIVGLESSFGPTAKGSDRPESAPTNELISFPKDDREHRGDRKQPAQSNTNLKLAQFLRQPETRPISQEELTVEVKGMYKRIVLLEQKCKEVDAEQTLAASKGDPTQQAPLNNGQWQALFAHHNALLHEHHDFLLALQHPSACPTLSKLAGKYSIPARMWDYGIHNFLEVLRCRLPETLDHMLDFIYVAYSAIATLYDTVFAFKERWVECLGDLARYRIAIEKHDGDLEIWRGVARSWYCKAADKNPEIGRFHHHLAILSWGHHLQQLSFFSRSLTCLVPSASTRGSIKTLFQPVLEGKIYSKSRSRAFTVAFIKIHANLFMYGQPTSEDMEFYRSVRTGLLDDYIGLVTTCFREQGVSIALTNIAAIFEYGALSADQRSKSFFRISFLRVWAEKLRNRETASGTAETAFDLDEDKQECLIDSLEQQIAQPLSKKDIASSKQLVQFALQFTFTVLAIVLQRPGDEYVFPIVHVMFCFIWSLADVEKLSRYVKRDVPWVDICSFLNALAKPDALTPKIWAKTLPMPDGGVTRALPEDFAMRGNLCALWYHPEGWFDSVQMDIEERSMEMPSMAASRVERILWLGMGIASHNRWIFYDDATMRFEPTS